MPGSTPVYGLPYLGPSDPPDIAAATEGLAEAAEAMLTARRPMRGSGALNVLYTLTNSFVDLAGTTVTLNVPTGSAIWMAHWTLAGQLMTAGNISAICQLLVDGVVQGPQAIWNPGNVATATGSPRGGQSQNADGVLVGSGNHVFKLQAARVFPAGSTGDIRLDNIHTNLSVLVIPL